jgi:hypothetical protein
MNMDIVLELRSQVDKNLVKSASFSSYWNPLTNQCDDDKLQNLETFFVKITILRSNGS